MSFYATRWAAEQPIDKPLRKFVLFVLAYHLNEQDGETYPGQALVAEETGMAERTVRDHLKGLEEDGVILRRPRYDARGKRTYDAWELIGFEEWRALRRSEEAERRRLAADSAGSTTGKTRPHYRQNTTSLPADPAPAPYMNVKEPQGTSPAGGRARAGTRPPAGEAAKALPEPDPSRAAQEKAATAQARKHWEACKPVIEGALAEEAAQRQAAESFWRAGREALAVALGGGEHGAQHLAALEANLMPWSLLGEGPEGRLLILLGRSIRKLAAYDGWGAEGLLGKALGCSVRIRPVGGRDPEPIDPARIMRSFIAPLLCERGNARRLLLVASSQLLADAAARWTELIAAACEREVEIVFRQWAADRAWQREAGSGAENEPKKEAAPCG